MIELPLSRFLHVKSGENKMEPVRLNPMQNLIIAMNNKT